MFLHLKNTKAAAIILILTFIVQLTSAQIVKLDSFEFLKGKMIRVDDLGNIYAVNRDNSITLFKTGGQQFTHNEKSLGNVANVDVANPLKVLVHYAEANTILVMDNTLTEMAKINLENLGVFGLNVVVAASRMGGFWLFNPIQQSLNRYSLDGSKITGTQLGSSFENIKPKYLLERDSRVYMSLDDGRLLVFDINGTYIYKFPKLYGVRNEFQINAGKLQYLRNDTLLTLFIESLQQKKLPLPPSFRKSTKKLQVFSHGEKYYALLPKQIMVFKSN